MVAESSVLESSSIHRSEDALPKMSGTTGGSAASSRQEDTTEDRKPAKKTRNTGRFTVDSNGECKDRWEVMFDRLKAFRKENGHCLVPNRYKNDRALGSWVSTQRRQFKILTSGSSQSTPMTPERASRLISIGFQWEAKDPRHVPWETRFKELSQFKQLHGHCLVPISYKLNPRLSNWVSTQRQEKKLLDEGRSSRLTPERVKALEDLGFVWEAQRGGSRKRGPEAYHDMMQSPQYSTDQFLRSPSLHGGMAQQGQASLPGQAFMPLPSHVAALPTAVRRAQMHHHDQTLEGMIEARGRAQSRLEAAALQTLAAEQASRARDQALMFEVLARERALQNQRELLIADQLRSMGPAAPYGSAGLLTAFGNPSTMYSQASGPHVARLNDPNHLIPVPSEVSLAAQRRARAHFQPPVDEMSSQEKEGGTHDDSKASGAHAKRQRKK